MPNDDSRLLNAYLSSSDPKAFTKLVAKLGPSVMRVCRTVLDDDHLAEDAFQATFLILYRKADEIEDPDRLRGWLCGTAYKTAARLRRRAIRLATRERMIDVVASAPVTSATDHDVFVILREELDRLPEKYRAPLILCYLEGLSHQQVADHLKWATGTVKARLVRGKRLLRERLDRRKVVLAAALVALWRRESAAAPPEFVDSTIETSDSAAPVNPASSRTSNWASVRTVMLAILIASLAATTLGAIVRLRPQRPAPEWEANDLPDNLTDLLTTECS